MLTFALKVDNRTLVRHSRRIPFPSSTRWQTSIITQISTLPLANITSAHTSEGPTAFPGFTAFVAITVSLLLLSLSPM